MTLILSHIRHSLPLLQQHLPEGLAVPVVKGANAVTKVVDGVVNDVNVNQVKKLFMIAKCDF